MLTCDVLIPVGPNHEQIYHRAADSVRIACLDKGPFEKVSIRIGDDFYGSEGRSQTRNNLVASSEADWLFFLDADDLMHPDALSAVEPFVRTKDAIWGNVFEYKKGTAAWRYQVPQLVNYKELLAFDPYMTLQMGHFVRRTVAKQLPFNEDMDTGEDWDYYLRAWKDYRCVKIPQCLMINFRGQRSTGPRSATGVQWIETVRDLRKRAQQVEEGEAA